LYVYIMTNKNCGVLYVGITNDILRRVGEYRAGQVGGFSKRYNLDRVVFVEFHDTPGEAIEREKQIKGWSRNRKEKLIESVNPGWEDMWERLAEDAP
jgi:putative endonuclease